MLEIATENNRINPPHIDDRFILEWPTTARPTRISRPFGPPDELHEHEGVDIQVSEGAEIMCAASGSVTKVVPFNDSLDYGPYLQITTHMNGQTYIVTYAGVNDLVVHTGQFVGAGDKIGVASGNTLKLIAQNPPDGLSGFPLPNVVDPTLMIYWQGLRLKPIVNVLRVRSHPGTYGDILGGVTPSDVLETEEIHGRTLAKLDVEGQWLRIRYPGVDRAYVAAWFLRAYDLDDPVEGIPGINIPGVNLDIDERNGTPDAEPLENLGWVRLPYNVSLNPNYPEGDSRRYGNTNIDFTFNRYKPLLERYARLA